MSVVESTLSQELHQAMNDELNGLTKPQDVDSSQITHVLTNEATPLLGQGQSSQAFYLVSNAKNLVVGEVEGISARLVSPLLSRLAIAERNAKCYDYQRNWVKGLFLEMFILSFNTCPESLRNIQDHSLAIAPIVSAGHLSATALSATAVASLVANVTGFSIIRGLTSALDALLAESSSRRLARIRCGRAALVSLLAFPFIHQAFRRADVLFRYLRQDSEVIKLAYAFIKITAIGLPAFTINEITKRYLASQGLISVQTAVLTAVAPVNIMMTYILVYGPKSLNLGFIGAPLSMTISYISVAVLTVPFVVIPKGPRPADTDTDPDTSFTDDMKHLFLEGLAGLGRNASEVWSKEFMTGAASFLGASNLAAQSVLLATASTSYQIPRSFSSVTASRVKMLLGTGDVRRAVFVSIIGLMTSLFVVVILSNGLLVFAAYWAAIFTIDPVVVQTVTTTLPFVSLYIALQGFDAWLDSMFGVLGKSSVLPALHASLDYSVGIPLGLWLTFVRHWGLRGLWTGLTVAMAVSLIIGFAVLVVKPVRHIFLSLRKPNLAIRSV